MADGQDGFSHARGFIQGQSLLLQLLHKVLHASTVLMAMFTQRVAHLHDPRTQIMPRDECWAKLDV